MGSREREQRKVDVDPIDILYILKRHCIYHKHTIYYIGTVYTVAL